jgi:hypothetical protein
MSYSDFKEQKLQLIGAADSVFSVEAADNLSDSLSQSTAFRKKVL